MASLPYPRSQNNTPTEFTEQTDREYYPTDFTDLHRYLLPQNSRNTEQTGREYYPTDFTDIYSHRIHGIHRTDWQRILSHKFHRFTQIFTPTEFTEYTEQTGREYYPTDFTNLHRYLLPQNSRNTEQIGREYYPTDFTDLHRYLLPQNSRNTQNRLAENIIPQISQIYTDIYSHRIHRIHRTFCLHLCKSVKSVGVSSQQ